jgi:hypothetical protein
VPGTEPFLARTAGRYKSKFLLVTTVHIFSSIFLGDSVISVDDSMVKKHRFRWGSSYSSMKTIKSKEERAAKSKREDGLGEVAHPVARAEEDASGKRIRCRRSLSRAAMCAIANASLTKP